VAALEYDKVIWVLLITYHASIIPAGAFQTFEDCDDARHEIIRQHPDMPAVLSCVQMEGA
jgi:hypothetical protein